MTDDNTQSETGLQQSVLAELEHEPVDQDWLVETLAEKHDVEKDDVLCSLRQLMGRGRIAYSIDWRLMIDE